MLGLRCLIFLGAFYCFLLSCHSRKSSDHSILKEIEIDPIKCEFGEYTTFTLVGNKEENIYKKSSIEWPDKEKRNILVLNGQDKSWTIRIDTCLETGENPTAKVVRLIHYLKSGDFSVFLAEDIKREKGMTEAILGNHGFLDIFAKKESGMPLTIQGDAEGNYAIATLLNLSGNPWLQTILAGKITLGNSLSSEQNKCGAGVFGKRQFRLGTAIFEAEACSFPGGGYTTGYKYLNFSVEDKNPLLPEEKRKKLIFTSPEEFKDVLEYQYVHHNDSDWFRLTLPYAVYSAKGNRNERKVHYLVRYGENPEISKVITDCSQYYYCEDSDSQ